MSMSTWKRLVCLVVLASVWDGGHAHTTAECGDIDNPTLIDLTADAEWSVTSPNFPANYQTNCAFTVRAPEGERIILRSVVFRLKYTQQSLFGIPIINSDSLIITDRQNNLRIGEYETIYGPDALVSASNMIDGELSTKLDLLSRSGSFSLNIKIYEEFPKNRPCVEDPTVLLRANQFCDGTSDCPRGSDEFCLNECGQQPIEPDWEVLQSHVGKIVNGSVAVAHSWPWQIGFLFDNRLICGGSLIAPQWVMTAAHCCDADGVTSGRVSVVIGAHNVKQTEPSSTTIPVKKIHNHPEYKDSPVARNDFCLLQLTKPVKYRREIQPVCLPKGSSGHQSTGTVCYVSGWGTLQQGTSNMPDLLHQVPIMMHDQVQCNVIYDGLITPEMFCGYNRLRDTCQGDSGGPYVCRPKHNNTIFELTGVTSWGRGCARDGIPGVYAKTTLSLDWVAKVLYNERYDGWNSTTDGAGQFRVSMIAAVIMIYVSLMMSLNRLS